MLLQVEPQGRQVECEAGENLLDVLLRAAVPVSYSCRSGRCGTCRCTVRPLAAGPADTAAEVLACQTVLQQDCTVEISEPDEVVVHPARVLKATVLRIDAPTHDIRVLTLRPNKPLSYTPGQYATLQFANGQARPYSMAGVPGDEALEFHIRIVPGGQASGHVAGVLQPGDSVRVSGPLGTSYWRSRHAGPVICVAGGTGLAAVLSMLRGAVQSGHAAPIHLYFGVRSEADLYGEAELARLAAAHPALRVHVVVAGGPVRPGHRSGLVTDAIRADGHALAGWRAYLCGSPGMVEAVGAELLERGLEPGHLHLDAFFTPNN